MNEKSGENLYQRQHTDPKNYLFYQKAVLQNGVSRVA
jgi:hypothetical protein